jgi:hypothetical protein
LRVLFNVGYVIDLTDFIVDLIQTKVEDFPDSVVVPSLCIGIVFLIGELASVS